MNKLEEVAQKPNRNITADILKTLGLILIIMAHTDFPTNFDRLREFDVPMMVIVSGILFDYSCKNRTYQFADYLKKRIPRLIAPVWLFLAFFFGFYYIYYLLLGKLTKYPFSSQKILDTFFLIDGIGYVWIVRVFVIVAILSVFLLKLRSSFSNISQFFIAILAIFTVHEAIISAIYTNNLESSLQESTTFILFSIIPYGFLFGLGMCVPRMTKKELVWVASFFGALFFFILFYKYSYFGHFIPLRILKFPPRVYYVAYGIFMTIFIYLTIDKFKMSQFLNKNRQISSWILFISSSTLWIYLWHIFFIYNWYLIRVKLPQVLNNFVVFFLVVAVLSIATTYWQKKVMSRLIETSQFGQKHSEILGILFLK
ncbi:acyltransferase family protein [Microcoleus sp. FACHB-672]|uniref:acyltransferase family protein n=1 Tax=Microcoleus sp. FACHB-672 TaxID=2692825 RepID=UPI0016836BDA|nr:acyltransferase [Microcoleus sp. FACHB-672]MBD2043061.1 acyltransferase [Microcoleus sp. FACHB-672]